MLLVLHTRPPPLPSPQFSLLLYLCSCEAALHCLFGLVIKVVTYKHHRAYQYVALKRCPFHHLLVASRLDLVKGYRRMQICSQTKGPNNWNNEAK